MAVVCLHAYVGFLSLSLYFHPTPSHPPFALATPHLSHSLPSLVSRSLSICRWLEQFGVRLSSEMRLVVLEIVADKAIQMITRRIYSKTILLLIILARSQCLYFLDSRRHLSCSSFNVLVDLQFIRMVVTHKTNETNRTTKFTRGKQRKWGDVGVG